MIETHQIHAYRSRMQVLEKRIANLAAIASYDELDMQHPSLRTFL